jgi:hypothetical protein
MGKRLNPRKKWRPRDSLALLGYYTTPVQKVVDRWRTKIGKEIFDRNIESLMIACNYSVQCSEPTSAYFHHKRFALELALAVEKVRRSWRREIESEILNIMLEHYITPLLSSISNLGPDLEPLLSNHKQFILELMLAVDTVVNDRSRKDGGILAFAYSGDGSDYENGVPVLRSWPKVAKLIAARSGLKKIEPNTIAQLAKRMRLTE